MIDKETHLIDSRLIVGVIVVLMIFTAYKRETKVQVEKEEDKLGVHINNPY